MGDARHALDATVAALRARVAMVAPDAIVSAEVVAVEIPLRAPVPTASGAWTRRPSLLVLLRDAGGAVGVGEVALPPADALGPRVAGVPSPAAGSERLAARMLGATPARALDLLDELRSSGAAGSSVSFDAAGDADLARATAAGFEAALLDLAARRSGTSVAALLHAALATASLPVAEPRPAVVVSALVAAPDPEVAGREARRFVDAGHDCVKLKVGDEPDDAALVARVGAVRSALGPGRELRLDANAAWTIPVAVARLAAVAPFDVAYVEQPVASIADLATLRARATVRVAADESIADVATAAEVLGLEAADFLVVKPSRVGGVAETLAIAVLALERGVPVVLSTFLETGVGLAAALHVAAVLPGPDVAHGLATGGLLETDLLAEPLVASRGRLAVPGAAGLGVDLDAAAVERYRVGVAAGSSTHGGGSAAQPPIAPEPAARVPIAPGRDWLLVAAERDPGGLALVDGAVRLSWGDLFARADALATRLLSDGLGAGARVATLAGPHAPFVVAVHALRRAGAVIVPLGGRSTPAENARALADAAPHLLLHDVAHADAARAAVAAASALGVTRIRCLSLPGLGVAAAAAAPEAALPASDVAVPPPAAITALRDLVDPAAPASILYTSGTTGRPKGAILTWGNHRASADAWASVLGRRVDDRWLLSLSGHHIAGLATVLRATIAGVPLVLAGDRFDAAEVLALVRREAVTHLSVVAATLERLLDALDGDAPPSLRGVLLGGGPWPASLVHRAVEAGIPVVPSYGMTETASGVVASPPAVAVAHPSASGRALAGALLRIEAGGRPVPPDAIGEIVVSGPMVMAGYLGLPAETSAAIRDGWLHTGDLGRLDADGILTVVDRRDDLVISGGENIYPAEVEEVLLAHPAIADACVVGIADGRWGAVPVAAIALRPGGAVDEVAVRAFVRDRLAPFKVPARVRVVASIPRTAGGKVRRTDVRALFGAASSYPAPASSGQAVRHTIRRGAADVAYAVTGTGPGVVLLHATLSRARAWRPLVRALAGRARVVAVDRRGHRASPDPDPMRLTFPDHVADVAALIEREGLAPAVVVGHSFGGCVALDLAAARPDLVRAVVAYEPPYLPLAPEPVRREMARVAREAASARAAGDGPQAVEIFLRAVLGDPGFETLPPAVRATVLEEGDAAASDSRLAGLRPERLPAIAVPVAVAVGQESHPFYAAIAGRLVATIPGARLVRVPGADHMGAVTRPDAILALIEEALAGDIHAALPSSPATSPARPHAADAAATADTADTR